MPVRLALCDLGAPSWGEPCFRIVLCPLLTSRCGDIFDGFSCFGVWVCFPPYPDRVDTILSPFVHCSTLLNWPANHTLSLCCWFLCFVFSDQRLHGFRQVVQLLVFVLVACLCLLFVCVGFLFLCCLFVVALLVTAIGTMYRSMPAQHLKLFSIVYVNALISQFILLATCN